METLTQKTCIVPSRKWLSVFDPIVPGHTKLTLSRFSYVFVNIDSSRDWELCKDSAETVSKFSLLIEVLLRESADGLVRGTSPRSHLGAQLCLQINALKRLLRIKPSGHDSLMRRLNRVFGGPRSIAASLFMETAATAALYSKAVALVINYILDNSKAKEVHSNLHPRDVKGDGEVISLIREALSKEGPHEVEPRADPCVRRPKGPRSLLGRETSRGKTHQRSFGGLRVGFSCSMGNISDSNSLQTFGSLVLRKGPCPEVLDLMNEPGLLNSPVSDNC